MSVEYSIRVIATGTECLFPCGTKLEVFAKAKRIMALAGYDEPKISRFFLQYPHGSETEGVAYVWDTISFANLERAPKLAITRRKRSITCQV